MYSVGVTHTNDNIKFNCMYKNIGPHEHGFAVGSFSGALAIFSTSCKRRSENNIQKQISTSKQTGHKRSIVEPKKYYREER